MADIPRGNRPLSPHLSIYRMQMPMVTSILTRITGISLIVAGLLITCWFLAAATSPAAFARADAVLTSWFGDLVLTLSIWALWYHALAGLRHLIWHSARWMDLPSFYKLSWAVIAGSVILTLLTLVTV